MRSVAMLLAISAVPTLAQTPVTPAEAPTPDATAQTWGVLAEMAGREYEGKDFFISVRWDVPGKHLHFDHWMGDWSGTFRTRYEFDRDPVTGTIAFFSEGRARKDGWTARVAADGSISIAYAGDKFEPWLSRSDNGAIILGKNKRLITFDPAGKQSKRLAKLIAEGRILPSGAPSIAVPSTSVAANVAKTGASQAPIIPGAPMTEAQIAGLNAYIGKTYVQSEGGVKDDVLRLRWLTPGSQFEMENFGRFGPTRRSVLTVAQDGRIAIEGNAGVSGQIDAAGLPTLTYGEGAQAWRTRVVAAGPTYQVFIDRNTAKAGKPYKWKLARTAQRSAVDEAVADQIRADFEAQRQARWAPFSGLVGNPQFCVQHEPGQYLTRSLVLHPEGRYTNRSFPLARLTTARWVTPYAEMEIISTYGSDKRVTDRVKLRPDGTFSMTSDATPNSKELIGKFVSDYYAVVNFDAAVTSFYGSITQTGIWFRANAKTATPYDTKFYGPTFIRGGDSCTFEPFDPAKIAEYEAKLRTASLEVDEGIQKDQDYWAEIAQDRAAGQAMLANIRGELFRTVVVGIPQAIASVQQQRAQLENLRIAAEQETALKRAALEAGVPNATAPSGPSGQTASNQSNVSEAASTTRPATGAKIRKPFRFHLIVGLENRPQDTANALCMSNAINESFEGEENGWGDNALRDRIFENYRSSFEEKCSRLRPLQGTTTYAYDQGWNSGGIGVAPNNMYFRVTLP